MTAHLNGVSVSLTARFHSGGLPYVCNPVDGVLFAVLPDYLSGQHHTIGIEICIDLHIHFGIHNYTPSSTGSIVLFICPQGRSQPLSTRLCTWT